MDEADVQQFVFIRTVTRIPKEIRTYQRRGSGGNESCLIFPFIIQLYGKI